MVKMIIGAHGAQVIVSAVGARCSHTRVAQCLNQSDEATNISRADGCFDDHMCGANIIQGGVGGGHFAIHEKAFQSAPRELPGISWLCKCAHLFRNVACPHAPSNWRSEAKPHVKDRYSTFSRDSRCLLVKNRHTRRHKLAMETASTNSHDGTATWQMVFIRIILNQWIGKFWESSSEK